MKKKLYFLFACFNLSGLYGSDIDSDFDDTPVMIVFIPSDEQLASINPLDKQAFEMLVHELITLQHKIFENLLSPDDLLIALKKLYKKGSIMLADKDSQLKLNQHINNVAGHYNVRLNL